MITFSKLGELGRLGNQLFQYAAIRSLGLKNNFEVKLPDIKKMQWHGQKCLLDQFNIPNDLFADFDLKQEHKYFEKDWRKFDESFFEISDNTNIEGFFQSIRYFQEFQNQIKNELTPKKELILNNSQYLDEFKKENAGFEIVSIHIRRGDNLTNNQHGLIDAFKTNGIFDTYIKKAISCFESKKVKFLIFSGGARFDEKNQEDIDWCKNYFCGDQFLFSEGQNQLNDFTRIMLCDHNILSHASSFGWWAAFLNPNPQKIVVAPEYYHPDEPNLVREYFYPNEYILK